MLSRLATVTDSRLEVENEYGEQPLRNLADDHPHKVKVDRVELAHVDDIANVHSWEPERRIT